MAFRLFGFQFGGNRTDEEEILLQSPVVEKSQDGAVEIETTAYMNRGLSIDIEGHYRTDSELITKYRVMANRSEIDEAIENIINDAIVYDDSGRSVNLVLDSLKQPERIKKAIRDEFETILKLLDFRNEGSNLFRRWYVDGRLYHQVIIDTDNPMKGIIGLVYIDPRRIKKVRVLRKETTPENINKTVEVEELYIYSDRPLPDANQTGQPQLARPLANSLELTKDSVVYIHSGITDGSRNTILSYLHKAIRPMNQLRFMEDAIIIYTLARAPERRVFYIDVGTMVGAKADQYMKKIRNNFKNKIVYDSNTGEIQDSRRNLSLVDDYWIPRRGEGRGTEIGTLPSSQSLIDSEIMQFFKEGLYRALNVPASRMETQQGFSLGRSTEITRDEVKFNKFIEKLRGRFSGLFSELLERQLILKGVCSAEDWKDFKQDIHFDFIKDNNFSELKDAELWQNRLQMLSQVDMYVGKYFTRDWIYKNILHLTDEEIEEMIKQLDEESKKYPELAQMGGGMPMGGFPQDFGYGGDEQDENEPNDVRNINNNVRQLGAGGTQ